MALNCLPGDSITIGSMANEIDLKPDRNLWHYYYYADETIDRILGMDPITMTERNTIYLDGTDNHSGSVDRVGLTDKMYVRTAHKTSLAVVDAFSGTFLKRIELGYPPRMSGGWNPYRNLHVVSTKGEPHARVIDVFSDKVVISVGTDHTTEEMGGNDGGNATGHSRWLDRDHFVLLDRYRNEIYIYKINEDFPPYTTTLTDTFTTTTSPHAISSVGSSLLLDDRTFYIAVEGSIAAKDNVVPEVVKVTFDSVTGAFTTVDTVQFTGATVDSRLHHFGINPAGTIMGVPLSDINNTGNDKAYIVDLSTFDVTKTFDIGLGGGHCDFSDSENVLCVTNHYDTFVSMIDLVGDTVINVPVAGGTPAWGTYLQSHRNWVTGDGKFFYLFETDVGTFIEINITTRALSRSVVTGGTPIQSTS